MSPLKPISALIKKEGWQASLSLSFVQSGGKTVLGLTRRLGPLTVQQPFYPENEVCHIYLLHPPGGIVGGDHLSLEAGIGSKAHVVMTTPGATKFYRSNGQQAVQEQHFSIEPGGVLEWFPQESILFDKADCCIRTAIDLAPGARFMGWEVLCLGQPARAGRFERGRLDASLRLFCGKTPLLMDRFCINGEKDLDAAAGMRGHPVFGSFFATGVAPGVFEKIREQSGPAHSLFGMTLLDDLLVARYLGESPQKARHIFQDIWMRLRPELLGRPACVPRIWNT